MASADPYALIGQSIKRVEDDRLLRGHGRFLADLRVPGTLEAVFVRSPHAHATILRVDVTGAGFQNGLLHVDLVRNVPERMKPRSIAITGDAKPAKQIEAKG